MKIKYCERCGLFLGLVNPTKRYCSECKHKMDKERDKKRKNAYRTKTQELEKQKRFRLSEKFKCLLISSANTTATYHGCLRQES